MSTLSVVATPIGNLEDITLRAIRTLREADLILAEDTRTTAKLLKACEIQTPLRSYHMHNEHATVKYAVEQILSGTHTALVSDAGMPGISDPGYLLVHHCIKEGIAVEVLPGASAAVTALIGSGLPCDRFVFEGFLPHKKGRTTRLQELLKHKVTTILYESPMRLIRLLREICEQTEPDRQIVVARELTKVHEEYIRGTVEEVLAHFETTPPLGEIVVLIAPAPKREKRHQNKFETNT